jgi:glycosyltransferase involved in cell wall biosynthesis
MEKTTMKIAFESTPLSMLKKTGIQYYAAYLIKELLLKFPDNEYTYNFFCIKHKKEKFETINGLAKNPSMIHWFPFTNECQFSVFTKVIPIPYHAIFKEKCQVTHFFNYLIPSGVKGKKVVNVHDMTSKAFPETTNKFKLMLDIELKNSCKRADKIITVSNFSKEEIVKYLSVNPDKIAVTPLGVDTNIFYPLRDQNSLLNIKKKFGIRDSYFLYIGTIEPRKNIKRMIEAYAILKEKYRDIPQLILAGQLGWNYDSIFKSISENRLENEVKYINYISDEDKPLLLNGAFLFIYPSLYEGFGLPPLEAMACGIPVITSNVASLPEVVGDAALIVNPFDIDSIFNGMECLISDRELREDLSRKAISQAKRFSWSNTASMTMNVYQSVL